LVVGNIVTLLVLIESGFLLVVCYLPHERTSFQALIRPARHNCLGDRWSVNCWVDNQST